MRAQKLGEASQKKYDEMKDWVIKGLWNPNLCVKYKGPLDGPNVPPIR